MTVKPYKDQSSGKKEQVAQMFDNISKRYDFLNTLLSAGIDKGWRKKALSFFGKEPLQHLLDVATGTGEFALQAQRTIHPIKITGVDISAGMLEYGKKKITEKGLSAKIELLQADSENLPFPENTFDGAMVAFGVRNFENLEKGLSDIYRVLQPGSKLVVLEFSQPQQKAIAALYLFYFKNILPSIGKLFSGDASAYTYLPESVGAFPYGEQFGTIMKSCGYKAVEVHPLTFGIASVYVGVK